MSSRTAADVVLLGYQDQGNLGLGYLAAVLQQQGRSVDMIDIREGPESIATRLISRQPLVVGFSLIFQYFLPQYRRAASCLREVGIKSHFTIGGHHPSLCHDEILPKLPGTRQRGAVRRRGDAGRPSRAVESRKRLAPDPWDCVSTPEPSRGDRAPGAGLRPGRAALSASSNKPEQIGGFPTLPLLASRGCARRCSFCSIHTFYRTAPGKVVRVRKPAKVIQEMRQLHRQHGVHVFLFQDDDFPLWGKAGRRWADELAERFHDSGLAGNTVWKISCRAEYVEPELFSKLRDAGLFLVYMGSSPALKRALRSCTRR